LTFAIFGFRPWRTSWLIVGTETLFLSRGLLVRRPSSPDVSGQQCGSLAARRGEREAEHAAPTDRS
jgi:hypothetical protein